MKTFLLSLLSLVILVPVSAKQPKEYHAVVSSTRTYMDVSRVTKSDYWFTKDKTYITNGRVSTIVRNDLGVIYTLIVSSNTYYVDSIKRVKKEEPTPKEIDFRHLGVDRYSTEYDWIVERKSRKDTTGMFTAEHYVADGDADFDQVSLEFWITKPDDPEMAALFQETQVNGMSYLTSRKPLVDHLKKNKHTISVQIIELIDNPISPPIRNLIVVEKIEAGKAPTNVFELPAGAKKAN